MTNSVDKTENATPSKNESIADLYSRLEAEDKTRSAGRGEKAEKIRSMTKDIAKETGNNELLLATVYKMCEAQFIKEGDKLDRPHFTQVVEKAFGTKKVDGRLWITMDGSGKKAKKSTKKSPKPAKAVTADDVGKI